MGVKERQEREREAVSRAILDAARDLFVAEGYPHVSIRKIAERIEYSPAAIYGYFPSKDDIFFALAEEGFRLLISSAAQRDLEQSDGADPLSAVRRAMMRRLRVQQVAPRVFRADVPRPFGAADQQGLEPVRVRPRHAAAAGRPHPAGDRRRATARRAPIPACCSGSC